MRNECMGSDERKKAKDRDLIEHLEALDDVLNWLEEKDECAIDEASESVSVDEQELKEWLKSPQLKKVRDWLEK